MLQGGVTNYFQLLVGGLAVYRLALMLSSESGPLELFAKMRKQVPAQTNQGKGIFAVSGVRW
jgi:hypothetical protein